jgi:hypothetical protein
MVLCHSGLAGIFLHKAIMNEKLKSQKIIEVLNAVYSDAETGEEQKLRQAGKEGIL